MCVSFWLCFESIVYYVLSFVFCWCLCHFALFVGFWMLLGGRKKWGKGWRSNDRRTKKRWWRRRPSWVAVSPLRGNGYLLGRRKLLDNFQAWRSAWRLNGSPFPLSAGTTNGDPSGDRTGSPLSPEIKSISHFAPILADFYVFFLPLLYTIIYRLRLEYFLHLSTHEQFGDLDLKFIFHF